MTKLKTKKKGKLGTLTDYLDRLDAADIHYTLTSVREGSVLVGVTLDGERWEIEFRSDGDVEIEIFRSDGEVHDESMLDELFRRAADD